MDISTIIEITIDGFARGMLYALLGAGITLVFGLGSVLNLSLGMFAVIAVVAGVVALPIVSHPLLAALVGVGVVGAMSLVVDQTLLTSVYKSEGEERITLGIFTTLGLEIALAGLLYVYYPQTYAIPYESFLIPIEGVAIRSSTLLVIAIAGCLLVLLFLFLRRTYLGKATRTVFQDETGALLCGINPRAIRTIIFVLSAIIAAIAGILWSLQSTVNVESAFQLTIFGILVSIVGGVRNIKGTIAAGIFLGLIVTYANYLIGSYFSMVILFSVAVGVLVARPEEIA
ncbi:branched-chain amino acid ABC transporter permease [Natronosalvus halobius]|uniref:branched-chain amino acid ABC transporter permease n=1 Tax=Natronosalvus halobius TaxID=2953746 RepID=UPI0020A21D5D|nr:branched-chain amino acid ABC transporter permease [Natronosalvus halobius]USZ73644.1 branched-chain amino acid ABC transporter permease [Natronosalvus halobius]